MRVAALLLVDGKVVTVRHRSARSAYHLLPGGGVAAGETLAEALVREVLEETGLRCEVGRPLLINDTIAPDASRHIVNILFEAHVTGGSVTRSPSDARVEAVDLFDADALHGLDLRPPYASEVADLLRRGATAPTRYLGAIYTEER